MIRVGDIVKVVGHGAHDGWACSMDDMVGKKYEVSAIEEPYYVVEDFLFYADELEKVESEHKAKLLELLHDVSDGFMKYDANVFMKYEVDPEDSESFWRPFEKLQHYIEEYL